MIREKDLWVPINDGLIPDKFNPNYSGQFSSSLVVNTTFLNRFLTLAALTGTVSLRADSNIRSRDFPQMNSDGSRSLSRPSDLLSPSPSVKGFKLNKYVDLLSTDTGWDILINSDQISQGLVDKSAGDYRRIGIQFGQEFDSSFKDGLIQALVKDKLTTTKDPYFYARLTESVLLGLVYHSIFSRHSLSSNELSYAALSIQWLVNILKRVNLLSPEGESITNPLSRIVRLTRKTLDWPLEVFGLPVEFDRLGLACGYLQANSILGRNIIRTTSGKD